MNVSPWLWVLLGLAIVLDLISSAAKSAFTHVRLSHLLSSRERDQRSVDRTVKLLEKQGLRTALRLALIFSHFMVAGIAGMILWQIVSGNMWLVLLILIVLMNVISVFEFLLEGGVLHEPERSAISWTGTAQAISLIFTPFTRLMMSLLGENAEKVTLSVTDESLRDWVELGQSEGSLEKGEREMIYSIFQFGDTMAKEIMVPRMDVLALDINTKISEAREDFIEAGHSRVPVYEDTIDNVVGLLYAKDMLAAVDSNATIAEQRQLIRPAYFVPEAKKVDELLTEMQSRGIHMALVVDEYGGVSGVVTLEDIVEEIVGEIRDEYDTSEEQLFEKNGEDTYIIQGRVTIDEFNEITGADLSDEYADTLGGYIYGLLGRVPQPGEQVTSKGIEFTVEEVVARRILKVRVCMNPEKSGLEDEGLDHTD